jgi:hypothetical protein
MTGSKNIVSIIVPGIPITGRCKFCGPVKPASLAWPYAHYYLVDISSIIS